MPSQRSFRATAIFDGKQFHSSLETSALLGSTSRGAALCTGAAGLTVIDHRAPETRSRISARTIASCVSAGVRTNCGRKRVYARLRRKCVLVRANGRGGGVRHCPHDMTMPLACPISALRCCFVWAICSSCLLAEGGPCRRYPGVLKASSGCLPLKPMLPDLTMRARHRSLGR